MDAFDLIGSFATAGSYTVTRHTRATVVSGRHTPSAATSITIIASVQPFSSRDLMRLPEGRRAVETQWLYTPTKLEVGGQYSNFEADIVAVDEQNWEVQQVERWKDGNPGEDTFYRCQIQVTQ